MVDAWGIGSCISNHGRGEGVLFMSWHFVFFSFFVFFSPCFFTSPAILDILKPKMAHQKVFRQQISALSRWNSTQQVLNPTPSKPHACNMPQAKQKLRCNFRNAALQKLHCNIGFSAVRMSIWPKAALQQAKNCSATLKKMRCKWRFPAAFLWISGSHV